MQHIGLDAVTEQENGDRLGGALQPADVLLHGRGDEADAVRLRKVRVDAAVVAEQLQQRTSTRRRHQTEREDLLDDPAVVLLQRLLVGEGEVPADVLGQRLVKSKLITSYFASSELYSLLSLVMLPSMSLFTGLKVVPSRSTNWTMHFADSRYSAVLSSPSAGTSAKGSTFSKNTSSVELFSAAIALVVVHSAVRRVDLFSRLEITWDQITTTSTTTTSTVTMKPLPDISRFRKYNDKYNVMNTPKGAKLFVAGTVGFLVWHHWYYGNP
ncbi:hypothetical protein TYRP_002882 [Tyrophagus putrescentiae]|nr:hypothetical protein TYRP_002882 [Tyrophagus putrescentiae]